MKVPETISEKMEWIERYVRDLCLFNSSTTGQQEYSTNPIIIRQLFEMKKDEKGYASRPFEFESKRWRFTLDNAILVDDGISFEDVIDKAYHKIKKLLENEKDMWHYKVDCELYLEDSQQSSIECPNCISTDVELQLTCTQAGHSNLQIKKGDKVYKCNNCGHHFFRLGFKSR